MLFLWVYIALRRIYESNLLSGRFWEASTQMLLFYATGRDFVLRWSFSSTARFGVVTENISRIITCLQSSGHFMVCDCFGEIIPLLLSGSFKLFDCFPHCCILTLLFFDAAITLCALVCQAEWKLCSLPAGLYQHALSELTLSSVRRLCTPTEMPRMCTRGRVLLELQQKGEQQEQNVAEKCTNYAQCISSD